MAMTYPHTEITDADVPRAAIPFAQHILDSYASETNKVAAVWREYTDADLGYRPHERGSTVGDILKHPIAPCSMKASSWRSPARGCRCWRRARKHGGCSAFRFSMSSESGSGCFGAACCTPRTTGPSSLSISGS